ncbi:MAG: hypothetical protein A2X55_04885 [Nitrospirae bacterium GWB2_47_37]|nr:MAG: hypothetical protein A2X55_04885 [Nitrospirae bacterium GWB2_47_37]
MSRNKKILLISAFFLLLMQMVTLDIGFILGAGGGNLAEGWFSDIAYNLNWEFTGRMAEDIPYGAGWSTGIGKLFFLIHNVFYKIFGVGLFQARLVSFASGVIMLVLLYVWVKKYISQDAAIFSMLLMASSPLFYTSIPSAKQDIVHCLFAFSAFYFISSAILTRKGVYYLLAGFIAALSVDISYRGIEIVIAVYLFHCIFFEREGFLKRSSLLLSGSFIAFIYWYSINILPIGIDAFLGYHFASAAGDGGDYNFTVLLSEFYRFLNIFSGRNKYVFIFELFYLVFLAVLFYKNRGKHKGIFKVIGVWVLINFMILTVIERTTERIYLLMYYTFLFIFSGIGLSELFEQRRKIAYAILSLILLFAFTFQGAIFVKYTYHTAIKKDYDIKGYYDKLRASVDINKPIIGTTNHWYAFPDARYYGGQFYLSRVVTILKELKPSQEYVSDYERAEALLKVFEKRGIEYVIADEYFKPTLTKYFVNSELPSKNFKLVNTITDMFLGKGADSKKRPYKTEIYKVISYEP